MSTDYDVAIIGAGPAGASCARCLAKNNLKVLVLERSTILRYKPCAGLLSDRSVDFINKHFPSLPTSMICNPSKTSINVSKTGNSFFKIPGKPLLSVHRHAFDKWLIDKSEATVCEKTIYRKHSIKNDIIELDITSGGKSEKITCKYLIGADGGYSTVRKNCDPNFNRDNYLISKQIVYTGTSSIDPKNYYFVLNKKFGDLLSWFALKNNLIYIGTSYEPKNKTDLFNTFYDAIVNKFDIKNIKQIRIESCLTDKRITPNRFYWGMDNILIIGEASGLISTYGEGISSALISGKIAAESILDAKKSGEKVIDLFNKNIKPEEKYINGFLKTAS